MNKIAANGCQFVVKMLSVSDNWALLSYERARPSESLGSCPQGGIVTSNKTRTQSHCPMHVLSFICFALIGTKWATKTSSRLSKRVLVETVLDFESTEAERRLRSLQKKPAQWKEDLLQRDSASNLERRAAACIGLAFALFPCFTALRKDFFRK
ncbi:hypothetical protein L596_004310 [Steinernema carpocapsae]|uniref:Uncharacterized protein n=1 Tax=Steinernema carpocapsae TaxID=34508 RepID=A0A4U8UVI8_STECR|nr:hypothetical protein L596_004310 [Steinernema carpocapsae]